MPIRAVIGRSELTGPAWHAVGAAATRRSGPLADGLPDTGVHRGDGEGPVPAAARCRLGRALAVTVAVVVSPFASVTRTPAPATRADLTLSHWTVSRSRRSVSHRAWLSLRVVTERVSRRSHIRQEPARLDLIHG